MVDADEAPRGTAEASSQTEAVLSVLAVLSHAPLVGREQQLRLIRQHVDSAAAHGRGSIVVIRGESGVGKTRLALEAAEALGRILVVLTCYPHLRAMPFAPFMNPALELGDLPEFLRSGVTLTSDTDRFQFYEQVDRRLVDLREGRPGVMVVDQLEWVDDASADLLRHLVRHSRDGTRTVIGTMVGHPRFSDPVVRLLTELNRERMMLMVPLAPLDRVGTDELMTHLLGATDPDILDAAFVCTDGIPFIVEEFVRFLVSENQLVREAGVWRSATGATIEAARKSFGIAANVMVWLRHLHPDTFEALKAAAVLGDRCHLAHLAALVDCNETQLRDRLVDAVDLAVFRLEAADGSTTPTTGAFTRSLVRNSIYLAMPVPERLRLHERAAEVLADAPPGTDERRSIAQYAGVTRSAQPDANDAYPFELSAREVEVLRLVAEGLTNSQIAKKLYLSPKTVSSHLGNIFSKIDVNTRASATRFAVEHGLV